MTDFTKLPPECDELCRFRSCYAPGENKGPYVPGRGYTSYYSVPQYVCMTRHLHGCATVPGKGGQSVRTLPDLEALVEHFKAEIEQAKATAKVKRLMRQMLTVIEECLQFEIGKEGTDENRPANKVQRGHA
jgi:hypothetical protein